MINASGPVQHNLTVYAQYQAPNNTTGHAYIGMSTGSVGGSVGVNPDPYNPSSIIEYITINGTIYYSGSTVGGTTYNF